MLKSRSGVFDKQQAYPTKLRTQHYLDNYKLDAPISYQRPYEYGDWEPTPKHKRRFAHKPGLRRKVRRWDGITWWEYGDPQVIARENLEREFGNADT